MQSGWLSRLMTKRNVLMTPGSVRGCIASNLLRNKFRAFLGSVDLGRTRKRGNNPSISIGVETEVFFQEKAAMTPQANPAAKLQKLKRYIDSLCGIYSRIARRLGVDRTYVSRVAKGERRSQEIETALIREFDRTQEEKSKS
jgi:hypothetical protein